MFFSAPVGQISRFYPNLATADIDRESTQVIAFNVEAATPFQIETAAVPITCEDTVSGPFLVLRGNPCVDTGYPSRKPFRQR